MRPAYTLVRVHDRVTKWYEGRIRRSGRRVLLEAACRPNIPQLGSGGSIRLQARRLVRNAAARCSTILRTVPWLPAAVEGANGVRVRS